MVNDSDTGSIVSKSSIPRYTREKLFIIVDPFAISWLAIWGPGGWGQTRVAYTGSYTFPDSMHGESLFSGDAGSSMDPSESRHDSDSSVGSCVDTVDMVPIAGDAIPVALQGC